GLGLAIGLDGADEQNVVRALVVAADLSDLVAQLAGVSGEDFLVRESVSGLDDSDVEAFGFAEVGEGLHGVAKGGGGNEEPLVGSRHGTREVKRHREDKKREETRESHAAAFLSLLLSSLLGISVVQLITTPTAAAPSAPPDT